MPGKKQLPSSSRGPKGKFPAYQLSTPGPHSWRTSGSHLPHIAGPQEAQNRNNIRGNRQDGSTGSHLEGPPSDSEISPFCCTTGWFGHWPSFNWRDRSTTPHLELPAVHHPTPDTSRLSPAHPDPKQNTLSTRGIDTTPNNTSSLHPQPERVGLDSDGNSAPASDGKKSIIIGTTELILQAAASALKFSPIPLLGRFRVYC
ncbi:uncharacterized protein EI90DRAFT_2061520 [Cantharellus anzutake]|uniref:uncharacterized protein n=1 Tax=Cantharellus anzutake TaxID=1750568 RepID=UPI001905C53B|nr:uncharacterized protein EI90DRAFT_2061520 [Cantharellus anzutake]KAF8340416.1 hypothetical protein EI90DRAFT_2061520 [Cantharellus anzutake]